MPKTPEHDFPRYQLLVGHTEEEFWHPAAATIETLYVSGGLVKLTGKALESTGIVRPVSELERAGLSAHSYARADRLKS